MLKPKNSMFSLSKVFFEFLLCLCFVCLVGEDHHAHIPKDSDELACSFSVHTWLNTLWHSAAWLVLGFIDQQSGGDCTEIMNSVIFQKVKRTRRFQRVRNLENWKTDLALPQLDICTKKVVQQVNKVVNTLKSCL